MEQSLSVITRKPGAFEKRIHEVDFARGICIILVLFDHLLWNIGHYFPNWASLAGGNAFLSNLGAFANWYWNWPVRGIVQFVVLCIFVFLSGISCSFSRDNWKRSGLMVILWFLLWIGSNVLNGAGFIDQSQCMALNFNVIGVIAFSVLFYCLFQKRSWKLLLANVLFLFLLYKIVIPILFYNFGGGSSMPFPLWSEWTYRNTQGTNFWNPEWNNNPYIGKIIVNGKGYFNADFMPLFPYIITFFVGVLFGRFFYKERVSLITTRKDFERPVCFMGRHSLIFYIGSTVVYIAIFALIDVIVKAVCK